MSEVPTRTKGFPEMPSPTAPGRAAMGILEGPSLRELRAVSDADGALEARWPCVSMAALRLDGLEPELSGEPARRALSLEVESRAPAWDSALGRFCNVGTRVVTEAVASVCSVFIVTMTSCATFSRSSECWRFLATAQNEVRSWIPTSETKSWQHRGKMASPSDTGSTSGRGVSWPDPSRVCFSLCFTASSWTISSSRRAFSRAKEGLGLRLRRAWLWFR